MRAGLIALVAAVALLAGGTASGAPLSIGENLVVENGLAGYANVDLLEGQVVTGFEMIYEYELFGGRLDSGGSIEFTDATSTRVRFPLSGSPLQGTLGIRVPGRILIYVDPPIASYRNDQGESETGMGDVRYSLKLQVARASVPEPASVGLVALGAAAAFARRRRPSR